MSRTAVAKRCHSGAGLLRMKARSHDEEHHQHRRGRVAPARARVRRYRPGRVGAHREGNLRDPLRRRHRLPSRRAGTRAPDARSANRLLGRRITFYVYAARGYTCEPLTTEVEMSTAEVKSRRAAGLKTPTNLGVDATRDISGALNLLLADLFALYLKTKNFHWHV